MGDEKVEEVPRVKLLDDVVRGDLKAYGDYMLPISKAAKLLGVHRTTLVRWIKKGLIRASKTPGGHYRVPYSEILAFGRAPTPLDDLELSYAYHRIAEEMQRRIELHINKAKDLKLKLIVHKKQYGEGATYHELRMQYYNELRQVLRLIELARPRLPEDVLRKYYNRVFKIRNAETEVGVKIA